MEKRFASVVSMSEQVVPPPPPPPAAVAAVASLLNLPIDSLHGIAGFLTCSEWSNFGQTSHTSNRACREVFKRMKLHGFRCAMEVISALVRTYTLLLLLFLLLYVSIHFFFMLSCCSLHPMYVCVYVLIYNYIEKRAVE